VSPHVLVACWDWLWTPVSGAAGHYLAGWAAWHGRLMVLAWGILIPLGGLIARYLKVLPGQDWPAELDNKWWWRAHLALQTAGLAAATLALLLAWDHADARGTALAGVHAWAGWLLLGLGAAQGLSGLLRGSKGGPTDMSPGVRRQAGAGDHYIMTRRRRVFERLHKLLGWLLIACAVPIIVLGLVVADAPRWMFVVLAGWWAAYALVLAYWQRQGRCIDTYQAIWGPEPGLPGNRVPPIGPGIRRYTAQQWRALLRGRPLWGMSAGGRGGMPRRGAGR
jgi:hypothetical protein